MTFDEAFERVVSVEGGYVDNAMDPGGRTKWGISQRAFPDVDIRAMTIEECKGFYKNKYWDALRCDRMPDALKYSLFDAAVNSGTKQAIKWLQRAMDVGDDGILGPLTLDAAQRSSGLKLAIKLNAERLDFMTSLPTWGSFSRGWARRIAENLKAL